MGNLKYKEPGSLNLPGRSYGVAFMFSLNFFLLAVHYNRLAIKSIH